MRSHHAALHPMSCSTHRRTQKEVSKPCATFNSILFFKGYPVSDLELCYMQGDEVKLQKLRSDSFQRLPAASFLRGRLATSGQRRCLVATCDSRWLAPPMRKFPTLMESGPVTVRVLMKCPSLRFLLGSPDLRKPSHAECSPNEYCNVFDG